MKDKLTSIADNFHYLLLNLYLYRRGSLFLPFLGSIFQILLSLITILIPKMLLDFVENKTEWKLILCWIVLSGIGLFIVSASSTAKLWYSLRTETRKQTLKEKRASVTRKLNYIAYRTRGIQEGKDIRIYSMVPWLREKARTAVKDKDRIERSAAYFEMQKMLLNGLLVFLRNGCAYSICRSLPGRSEGKDGLADKRTGAATLS